MAEDPIILAADSDFVGQTVTLKTGVTTVKPGTLLGYSAGWVKADADLPVWAEFISLDYGTAGDKVHVAKKVTLYDADAPYTAGSDQYLSTTAGATTETIPAASATLTYLQKVGVAISTDTIFIDLVRQGPKYLRIQGTVDPASAGTDTVQNLDVTLTGVVAADYVRIADSPALVQGVIYNGSIVAGVDKVTLGIANASAGTVDGAAKTVTFIVERW